MNEGRLARAHNLAEWIDEMTGLRSTNSEDKLRLC